MTLEICIMPLIFSRFIFIFKTRFVLSFLNLRYEKCQKFSSNKKIPISVVQEGLFTRITIFYDVTSFRKISFRKPHSKTQITARRRHKIFICAFIFSVDFSLLKRVVALSNSASCITITAKIYL